VRIVVRAFQILIEALNAIILAASIGVASGTLACAYTHRLESGLRVAAAGFAVAGIVFAIAIWRKHRRATEVAPVLPLAGYSPAH
jgi:hypothetical protein